MGKPEKRGENIVVNKIGMNASLPPEASNANARARKRREHLANTY